MINFSGISSKNVFGKFLRFPLTLLPKNVRAPILQGRLRGKKWIIGSSTHGCWLGSYEYEKQRLFAKTITEGSVVYDIGAHVGFYTLLASELVGPNGKVITFEPLPRNIHYLKEHLRLNRCKNVTVIEAAVAEKMGMCFFEESLNSHTAHISPKGYIKVRTVKLDDLVSNGEIPPSDYMKIDVEGAEMLVLSGARQLLANYNPKIFLATHGIKIHQQCRTFLKSIGYELQSVSKKNINESDEIFAFK